MPTVPDEFDLQSTADGYVICRKDGRPAFLSVRRNSRRNAVMFLLSVDAGLRAKEIASLDWAMITDVNSLAILTP